MSKGSTVVSFIIGIAIGAASAWYVTKQIYEKINEEEIESVKKVCEEEIKSVKKVYKKHTDQKEDREPVTDAVTVEERKPVNNHPVIKQSPKVRLTEDPDIPQVISPDEFGEDECYSTVSLRYYTGDGFLAEENSMELVEDIENVIGYEALDRIGEYEEDAIHVRNDRLRSYYEIISDERSYRDVIAQRDQRKERRSKSR